MNRHSGQYDTAQNILVLAAYCLTTHRLQSYPLTEGLSSDRHVTEKKYGEPCCKYLCTYKAFHLLHPFNAKPSCVQGVVADGPVTQLEGSVIVGV